MVSTSNHYHNWRAFGFDPKTELEDLELPITHETARELWEYAHAPMGRWLPCGTDDYYGDKKEAAERIALAIWRTIGRPLPGAQVDNSPTYILIPHIQT